MKFLSALFGGKDTADNILDKDDGLLAKAGGWFGNLNFTDEERAEHHAKLCAGVSEFVKSTLSENTVRSKTRRLVAMLWIAVELFLILLVAAAAPFDQKLAQFYFELAMSELMFWGTISVIGFFFGPYMLGKHIGEPRAKAKQADR